MDRLNIDHLLETYPRPSQEIHWVLAMSDELGNFYKSGDDLLFHSIRAQSLYLQGDYLRRPSLGHLDPAITVQVSDVHTIPGGNGLREGFVFLSSPYLHKTQYFSEIRQDQLQKLFYDQPISLGGTSGLRLGDHLYVGATSMPKRLAMFHPCTSTPAAQVLLGGPRKDQVIRLGMGVTFRNFMPPDTPEVNSVPELAVLQGLVTEADSCKGEVSVLVMLKNKNLAKFMQWGRLGESQVLQTQLTLRVDARHIEFVHRILPHALHQHGGATASLEPYDLVIVGHLDIVVVDARSGATGTSVEPQPDIVVTGAGELMARIVFSQPEDIRLGSDSTNGINVGNRTAAHQGEVGEAQQDAARVRRKRAHSQAVGPQPDSRALLYAMHGHGPLSVQMKLQRVAPLGAKDALRILAENARRFGVPRPGFAPYLEHIRDKVFQFALDKTRTTNNTLTDNTLHLNISGHVFACMLHDLVPWSSTLTMQSVVSLEGGVLMVELPTFESASPLLQHKSGLFDFANYRRGFVELDAPIVFKWEMYDTIRTADTSRSVDGFVAITFAGYEARNADNTLIIHDTRGTKASARQLRQIPSKCPKC